MLAEVGSKTRVGVSSQLTSCWLSENCVSLFITFQGEVSDIGVSSQLTKGKLSDIVVNSQLITAGLSDIVNSEFIGKYV